MAVGCPTYVGVNRNGRGQKMYLGAQKESLPRPPRGSSYEPFAQTSKTTSGKAPVDNIAPEG